VNPDYAISTVYPYPICRRSNGVRVTESVHNDGYIRCNLSGRDYRKHRLIAAQWLKNPNNLPQVDHINRDCCDNRITNLRWVSSLRNTNNRSNQIFVKQLPKDAIVVDEYNGHRFEDLYYHDDIFYRYNGINYVVKPKNINPKNGLYRIYATDTDGKRVIIYYSKFKRQYELV